MLVCLLKINFQSYVIQLQLETFIFEVVGLFLYKLMVLYT